MSVIIQKFNVIVKALTRHSYFILLKSVAPHPPTEPRARYTELAAPRLNPDLIHDGPEHAVLMLHGI
jgi:hypothetical protein